MELFWRVEDLNEVEDAGITMRSVNFDDYIKKKREFRKILLERGIRRLPRTKLKDPEEICILLKLAEERQKRWLRENRLERLGPRRWRIKI